MTALAAIHVGKKALGLDEDTYRDLLQRVTGKRSAGDLSPQQSQLVLAEMRRLGFAATGREAKPARPAKGAMQLDGPFAGKLRALWIAGWNLGVVHDRTDAALVAFVRRQTSIDHVSWVRDPKDASKAIEALKAWLGREARVAWPSPNAAPYATKRAVIAAQLAILGLQPSESPIADLDGYSADLGVQIRQLRK